MITVGVVGIPTFVLALTYHQTTPEYVFVPGKGFIDSERVPVYSLDSPQLNPQSDVGRAEPAITSFPITTKAPQSLLDNITYDECISAQRVSPPPPGERVIRDCGWRLK